VYPKVCRHSEAILCETGGFRNALTVKWCLFLCIARHCKGLKKKKKVFSAYKYRAFREFREEVPLRHIGRQELDFGIQSTRNYGLSLQT